MGLEKSKRTLRFRDIQQFASPTADFDEVVG